jgi:putative nucleotidyltransferase with HDIG domain
MIDPVPKQRSRVFIVNSNETHRRELGSVLAGLFDVSTYGDNSLALDALRRKAPNVVLVDDRMLEGCRGTLYDKRKDEKLCQIPFIVTGKSGEAVLSADGSENEGDIDLYVPRPFSKNRIITEISNLLSRSVEKSWEKLKPLHKTALQKSVEEFKALSTAIEERKPLDLESTFESCKPLVESINNHDVHAILESVKGHHNYTYVHSLRVATYLSLFGHAIGIRGHDLLTLSTGGLLHDVGKMVTPQDMLNKNGKLSDEEFTVIKNHVEHTSEILNRTPGVTDGIRIIAEQHHEKLNGKGYPKGLKGSELNDLARMSAIVDIFGALTDTRSYKPAFPAEKAFAILEDMSDGLDQSLIKAFKESLEKQGA